jgi:beta-galactosidase
VGHIDRRENSSELTLPKIAEGAKLEILVDATGRVADVKGYKDYKGLTEKVELQTADGNKKELQNWKMYSLPAEY